MKDQPLPPPPPQKNPQTNNNNNKKIQQTKKTTMKTKKTPKPNQKRKETPILFLLNLANAALMMYIRSVGRQQNSIIPQATGLICCFTDLSIHNAGKSRENRIIIK